MDGRGGCCIARCAPGAPDHMSTMDRIMLRFRPIAPKPVTPDGSSSESGGDALLTRGRGSRRKYVRDNNRNNKRRRKTVSTSPEQNQPAPVPVVTLPLLPETPDRKDSPAREQNSLNSNTPTAAGWLSFERRGKMEVEQQPYWWCGAADQSSCVTVECVTDAWVEGEGLGSTDEERRARLSEDTCPGFISDGYGRVTWTNSAYREMVGLGREKRDEGLAVALVMKVSYGAVMMYPSFTCRVRVVQLACGRERNSLTVPCDVWRMDCGGFAWRLDVKAALSLRLGC